jgi:photosystem II stability/assembly factor-like uncharacterized protein
MIMDPTNPSVLYLGESESQAGYTALLKSTDGGTDWIAAWDWFQGLRGSVKAVAIDPAHSSTVYVGLDDIDATTQESQLGLFKSTDGGFTWSSAGLNDRAVNLLAIDTGNPATILYAGTAGAASDATGFQGIYKSTDGGMNWAAMNTGLESIIGNHLTAATTLVIDRANRRVIYLGTSNAGVFRSTDGGAAWSPLNDGLTNLETRALVVATKPTHAVYAGTGGGVFKIADQ